MHPAHLALLNNPITVQRRSSTSTDDRGNPTGDYSTHLSDLPSRIEWLGGTEHRDRREVTDKTHRIFVDGGTDIIESDRIVFGARTFEITTVNVRFDPDGAENHRVIMCEEVK